MEKGTVALVSWRSVEKGVAKGYSTYCMNLSAAPDPQGNFRGRSNVLPKSTSSADMGRRNRPVYESSLVNMAL